MSPFDKLITASNVHFEWVDLLRNAFDEMDKAYLDELLHSSSWLPGIDLLFNAFKRDRRHVRYVLIGESPYPRQTSANGIAFYDAAVTDLWCATGLSKSVNRATSMRNIIKTALFSEGYIQPDSEGKISQASIAKLDKSRLVQTMPELFENLQVSGFLMLNATPVLYPDRKPVQEAKFWQGFLLSLLKQLGEMADQPMTLVLWGKIAETIDTMDLTEQYSKLVSEHPYNISFIQNLTMQRLFNEVSFLTVK
jgi:uracil-DNA glycosylase|tara:strand:- start:138 stop:890 length:753 start_codon:yes stop_codon:yes gene_type:complete